MTQRLLSSVALTAVVAVLVLATADLVAAEAQADEKSRPGSDDGENHEQMFPGSLESFGPDSDIFLDLGFEIEVSDSQLFRKPGDRFVWPRHDNCSCQSEGGNVDPKE